MRTHDQAWEAATDEAPFSNGTEGESWTAQWCDRCLHDAPFRNGLRGASGCPLLAVALMGRTPSEWLEQPLSEEGYLRLGDQFHCVEFKAPGARACRGHYVSDVQLSEGYGDV